MAGTAFVSDRGDGAEFNGRAGCGTSGTARAAGTGGAGGAGGSEASATVKLSPVAAIANIRRACHMPRTSWAVCLG